MKNEIMTLILGAMPISEVRGAIPMAMLVFGFSAMKAFALGVLGNILPIIPTLFFLEKFSEYLMYKWYWFNRLMSWLFERTQRKHMDHFHQWQWSWVALFIFVAIPLPMTGAWSGIIAAHVLGIPFWRSVLAIALGVAVAGGVVTILTSLGFLAAKSIL